MRDEMWQRGMRTVLCQFWRLPDLFWELRDAEPTPEARLLLATCVTRLGGMTHSLLSILSAANPALPVYQEPLLHLSEAIDLADAARADDTLTPEGHIFALLNALQITANSLYGTCLLLARYPHASGLDSRKLASAGLYFAAPAMLVASHLDTAVAWQRLLGAPGQPASTGLPSALLPPPGVEPGPWPGFAQWLEGWAKTSIR